VLLNAIVFLKVCSQDSECHAIELLMVTGFSLACNKRTMVFLGQETCGLDAVSHALPLKITSKIRSSVQMPLTRLLTVRRTGNLPHYQVPNYQVTSNAETVTLHTDDWNS